MSKRNDTCPFWGTMLLLLVTAWLSAQSAPIVSYPESFRFKTGDSPEWADPNFDDSDWEKARFGTLPPALRKTMGWARFVVYVEAGFLDKPLGLFLRMEGAAEIHLDGRLILTIGKVGASKEGEVPVIETNSNTYAVTFKSNLRDTDAKVHTPSRHVIAVRYSSFFLTPPMWTCYQLPLRFSIGDLQKKNRVLKKKIRGNTESQIMLSSIFMTLALLHMLLFLFYPGEKGNLFFSLFAADSAVAVFLVYQRAAAIAPTQVLDIVRLFHFTLILITLLGLQFAYSLLVAKPPWFFRFLLVPAGAILFIWNIFRPFTAEEYVVYFTLVTTIEIPRAIFFQSGAGGKNKRMREGSWIVGIGVIPLLLAGFYQILRN
ncbi:MAG: hypothetical protein GY765_17935, partial [bacterium]|nr:hypothetical protein [bacterium]